SDKNNEIKDINQKEKNDATITRVKEMVSDTGIYQVEETVKNKEGNILPGMVVQMDVPEKKVEDTLIVPTSAIVTEAGKSFIFIVQNRKAMKIDVTVTETQSDMTAIEGDVEPEDQVVINGQLTLADGSEVDVVEEENES